MATTPRWGLRYPLGTDTPDVPLWMQNLATDLDDVAKDDQGLLANRPVSTVGTPGKRGRYYWATDELALYRDHGTGWAQIAVVDATGKLKLAGELEVDGALNHDGATVGFYGAAPVARPASYTIQAGSGLSRNLQNTGQNAAAVLAQLVKDLSDQGLLQQTGAGT